MTALTAFVLTVSDGVTGGTRLDESGDRLAERLAGEGFEVERGNVPDELAAIAAAVRDGAARHPLVVTTGGTGLTPRDVTPQAIEPTPRLRSPGHGRADARRRHPVDPLAPPSRARWPGSSVAR